MATWTSPLSCLAGAVADDQWTLSLSLGAIPILCLVSRRRCYWRAMAIRISLSVSVMRSPDRSMVTVCRVPVNGKGAWVW
jgi:hypothetical protein